MELDTVIASLLGTAVGGIISYQINRQQHRNQMEVLRLQNKTDYMAEETVRHFLKNEQWVDRSFQVIRKHVGGFEDEELRKILVRAGAIRVFLEDGSEWWSLLERQEEKHAKKGKAVR
jgi:hypothetical protein